MVTDSLSYIYWQFIDALHTDIYSLVVYDTCRISIHISIVVCKLCAWPVHIPIVLISPCIYIHRYAIVTYMASVTAWHNGPGDNVQRCTLSARVVCAICLESRIGWGILYVSSYFRISTCVTYSIFGVSYIFAHLANILKLMRHLLVTLGHHSQGI